MKRIFNFSAAIAVVLSFASCQQTLEFSENIVNVKVVTDKIIEPEDAVKTYMGENLSTGNPEVKWNSGDAIVLYEFVDDATEPTQNPTSNGTELTEDDHIAKFNIPLSADKLEGTTYTYEAVYPANAVSEGGTDPNKFKRVYIPATQTAQFIGSDYFTANFDPAADVLLGVPVTRNSRPTESDYLNFGFKRVGTIGKLTLKNLWDDETVSCVEISLPDKSKLSGYSKLDIKGGTIIEAGYSTAEKITVNVPHSVEASMVTYNKEGENIPNVIYFRCLSGTWATGTEVTVKVTTDKAIYTKTTALPRDYEFIEGGLTSFSFNMATAKREEISTEDYSGHWMIVSENGGTLYAMPAYTSGKNNIPAVTYTLTEDGEATSADGLADCQYTITKITDGGTYDECYTIQDVNGLYLYAAGANSNNYMKGESELGAEGKFYWAITFAEGQYSIVAKSTGRNVMQYNSSSTLFSCYASATQVAVALFPWDHVIPAGVPVIQISSTELALNADGTEKDDHITVIGKNLTEEITATSSDESWLLAEVEGDELTVVAEENTGAEDRNATITLSSTGATDVVIEVTQDKASSGPAGNVLTFDFVTHPTGWPTAKASSKEGSYSYSLGGKNYTFTHSKSGDGIYCGGTSVTSGYLMVCNGNSLGLPAIEGYRLAKVVGTLNGSGTPSTKSVVSITDGTDVIAGGAAQTWNTKGGSYIYNLTDTEDNTVYYLSVGTANCQLVTLELTYEATVALSSIAISGIPTKTSYIAGESFDTDGLTVTATYEDGSTKDVTADAEWTVTPTPLTAGTTPVSVVATYKKVSSEAYVVNGITVTEPAELTSISVKTAPTKVEYFKGEKFDPAGLVVYRNYSDETKDEYAYAGHESDFTFNPALTTALTTDINNVTITYQGKSVGQAITVKSIANTKETAYTVAQARALIDAGKDLDTEVYVKGKISEIVTAYSSSYGNISFNVSDNGGKDGDQFQFYRNFKGADKAKWTDADTKPAVGNEVIGFGKLTKYGSTYEFAEGNYIVSITEAPYLNATATKTSGISADGEEITINVDTNRGSWEAVSSDDTNFKVGSKTATSIKVTVAKNTDTEKDRTATITVSAEGVDDVVITLTQSKAGKSNVTFGSDWNSLFGTSYTGSFSPKANALTLNGTANGASITVTNGSSTNGYVKTSDFRAYNGYTITLTAPTGKNITAISSTKGGKNFSSGVSANVGTVSISNNTISWTGSSNSVVLSISGTVSFATITLTYE